MFRILCSHFIGIGTKVCKTKDRKILGVWYKIDVVRPSEPEMLKSENKLAKKIICVIFCALISYYISCFAKPLSPCPFLSLMRV